MGVAYNTVYKGRDNSLFVQLSQTDEQGVVSKPDLTQGITKVEVLLKGKFYNSTDYPNAFDWTSEGATGIVGLKLGLIPELEVVKDTEAEILTYDPANPDGLVWGTIPIQVIELVGVEAK